MCPTAFPWTGSYRGLSKDYKGSTVAPDKPKDTLMIVHMPVSDAYITFVFIPQTDPKRLFRS